MGRAPVAHRTEEGGMPYGVRDTPELSIAEGAVLIALLEKLVERQILTKPDIRSVLADAVHELETRKAILPVKQAIDIVSDFYVPRFTDKSSPS